MSSNGPLKKNMYLSQHYVKQFTTDYISEFQDTSISKFLPEEPVEILFLFSHLVKT